MKNLFIILSLMICTSSFAHTIYSQDNNSVSHKHPTKCEWGCLSDYDVEQELRFQSSDRTYSATSEFNCHGRTFDLRRSWIDYSDAFIFGSGNMSVLYPSIGDVIVWTKPGTTTGSINSKITTHTATIVSQWDGLSTLVNSKYGQAGEYTHGLINTINVYGENYRIVRLNTYYNVSNNKQKTEHYSSVPWNETWYYKNTINELNEKKQLTLYEKFTKLNNANNHNLKFDTTGDQKYQVLFSDLIRNRYISLILFNHPSHADYLVKNIESGKLLIKMAETDYLITKKLKDNLIEVINSNSHDYIRGIAVYYLSLLSQNTGTYFDFGSLEKPKLSNQPYYSFYLNNALKNN